MYKRQVLSALKAEGVTAPVVVGGIIPEDDRSGLIEAGVSQVYTPKDYELTRIMHDVVDLVESERENRSG